MNPKQIFGLAGGFLFVYIVITLTNKPQVSPRGAETASESQMAVQPPGAPAQLSSSMSSATNGIGFCLAGLGAETLASAETDALIDRMSDRGGWVTISPALFQADGYASEVTEDPAQTPSEASLTHVIARCREAGLRVVLRPVVVAKDGTRRERFVPADPAAWFKSYSQALGPIADVAERSHVDVLSIGSTYAQLESSSAWTDLVKQLRSRYAGKLTYGAALEPESGAGGYQAVPFWRELDVIGLEAAQPTAEVGWLGVSSQIGSWIEAKQPGRQVIVTNAGFSRGTGSGDAMAFEQFQQAVGTQPWLVAGTWYQYESGGSATGGQVAPAGGQGMPPGQDQEGERDIIRSGSDAGAATSGDSD